MSVAQKLIITLHISLWCSGGSCYGTNWTGMLLSNHVARRYIAWLVLTSRVFVSHKTGLWVTRTWHVIINFCATDMPAALCTQLYSMLWFKLFVLSVRCTHPPNSRIGKQCVTIWHTRENTHNASEKQQTMQANLFNGLHIKSTGFHEVLHHGQQTKTGCKVQGCVPVIVRVKEVALHFGGKVLSKRKMTTLSTQVKGISSSLQWRIGQAHNRSQPVHMYMHGSL